MPKYDVSLTVSSSHTYVITVGAKDEDAAGDNVLAQFHYLRARQVPMPWDATTWSDKAEIHDVKEARCET